MNTRKEDVFESDAIPLEDLAAKFVRPETQDPDHVEMVHIDMDAARKKFGGRFLNVENIDFSDSIAKRRRQAYGSSAYVLEVISKGLVEEETPEQKFNRLTYELSELAETVKKDEKVRTNLLNENSVNELMDELKATKIAQSSVNGEVVVSKDKKTSRPAQSVSDSAVGALEARLRRLESILGKADPSAPSLIDTLDDLKFRTGALNSGFLDGVDSRLNSLLSKLDTIDARRKQTENGEQEAKVNKIYDLMCKWDGVCTNLPSNMKKLQNLRALHEHASQVSERVSQLVGVKEEMEKAASATRLEMAELQSQTRDEVSTLIAHIKSLDAKLGK